LNIKNWKTTSSGIVLIAGGLARGYIAYKTGTINEESVTTSATAVLTGLGLIFAKDANETGGTKAQ
jgi:hypothetical protein